MLTINFLNILLLFGSVLTIIKAQSFSYGKSFYTSITATPSYSFHHDGNEGGSEGFLPLTFKRDLITKDSKHRTPSKYFKKPSYKGYGSDDDNISSETYTSDEYLKEAKHQVFSPKERDSREYTIGAHIRIQRPKTSARKSTIPYPTKSTKYKTLSHIDSYSLDHSHEERASETYLPTKSSKNQKYSKLYRPDSFDAIPAPKSKPSSHYQHSSSPISSSYKVYDSEIDSHENHDIGVKHLKTNLRDHYKDVASKKQIEKYIEDQGKLLDETLKHQLFNNPNFQKILKTAEKEHQFNEPEFDDEYISNVPPPFRDSFYKSAPPKLTRPRHRPARSKPSALLQPNHNYRHAFTIDV